MEDCERSVLIGASAACLASLIPVALFQLGAIEHLPDPPSPAFDSDAITASRMAHPFGIPDSLLGLASYGVTTALAATSSRDARIRRALALKILFDGGLAATNTVRQIRSFRKLCSWCMGTVAASAVLVWTGRDLLREALELE